MVYNLIGRVNSPGDLKRMTMVELEALAFELRQFLIENIALTGGHLASNLGVVELTIALHRVFDSPLDSLVFDVGHQSYIHKILTGRRDRFGTIRRLDGLSGFTKVSESGYDAFGAGHSSTSISAALGICEANALQGNHGRAVAIIGDGAMTGGMAYEALNNAGRSRAPLIVVLNDNELSISPNVGAMARILGSLRSKTTYYRFKDFVRLKVTRVPLVGKGIYRMFHKSKMALKGLLSQGTIFEHMGFEYLGPVDGHDLKKTIAVLERARSLGRPVLVHVHTVKGKGYRFAEDSPEDYHGVSRFNVSTGRASTGGGSFSAEFGRIVCGMAERDKRICAITAAMEAGTGLSEFAKRFPGRFFDVGIAEQHSVTFAAGLARAGMLPVVAVYSTFLQRAYDQVLHDVALQGLKVIFAVDRAGLVGEDGPTHHGVFDVPYLSHIPGLRIYVPESYGELRAAFELAVDGDGPAVVRYPRGGGVDGGCAELQQVTREGNDKADVVFVSYGRVASCVRGAVDMLGEAGVAARMVRLSIIKPLPDIVDELGSARLVCFVEEGARRGGIGEQLGALMQERGCGLRYVIAALPDAFVEQGAESELLDRLGLSARGLYVKIMGELGVGG